MLIRRLRPADAQPTRDIFVASVLTGAAGRYTKAELIAWLPDPAMPDDWGDWLNEHITFVAEDAARLTGFMMIERDGYLNMAFVLPDHMGKGTADALYAAILAETQTLPVNRLTTLASRYFQSFLIRHGWQVAPDFTHKDLDPDQSGSNPYNRPMALPLEPK